jgi:hypothetical protein
MPRLSIGGHKLKRILRSTVEDGGLIPRRDVSQGRVKLPESEYQLDLFMKRDYFPSLEKLI